MPATKGNQFWKARSKSGRDKIFKTPESLRAAAEEYFEWNEANPLKEQRATQFQGAFVYGEVTKMRAMTMSALCRFLHIEENTWRNYREAEGYEDYFKVTKEIESIIYDQKFTGASADLLNANIIARDLGLADKQDHKKSGVVGTIDLSDKTDDELHAIINGKD